jgi:hypothetical protein
MMVEKSFDHSIIKIFGSNSSDKWKRLPYRCMISLYLQENLINILLLLKEVKTVLLEMNVEVLIDLKNDLKCVSTKFIKIKNNTGKELRPEQCDEGAQIELRIEKMERLKSSIQYNSDYYKNRP